MRDAGDHVGMVGCQDSVCKGFFSVLRGLLWCTAGNAPINSSIRSRTEETFVEVMMGQQRQSWSVEEKLGIVLAVLSKRQSVAEVARQRGVNENQIYRWKEQFLAAGRYGLNGVKAPTVACAWCRAAMRPCGNAPGSGRTTTPRKPSPNANTPVSGPNPAPRQPP
jgi:putative transposase